MFVCTFYCINMSNKCVLLVRLDYNLFEVICETGKAVCRPYFVYLRFKVDC